MKTGSQARAAVLLCTALTASLGAFAPASAANAAPPSVPVPPQSGCYPSGTRPNFAALPSGTRIFFLPVLTIRYPKPGVDVSESRFSAVNGQLQATVHDNTIYVNGKKTDALLSPSSDVNFQTTVEVCVYTRGQAVPANFTGIAPDLVLR